MKIYYLVFALSFVFRNNPIKAEKIKTFLSMYCPSILRTPGANHVCSGRSTSGSIVVPKCAVPTKSANLDHFLTRNKMPIIISDAPSTMKKASCGINEIVLDARSFTSGLAELSPSTFRIPNQKYTIKKDRRVIFS